MIEVSELSIPGVKRICLVSYVDHRGFFREYYRAPLYAKLGIDTPFVQDNHSFSKKGTIRGMHFQAGAGQAKLVTVAAGIIYDVFVDMRPDSPSCGNWGSYLLDSDKDEQLFIPAGFAHGFAVVSPSAHVFYKTSTLFDPDLERSFRHDDPDLGISWPVESPLLSERDLIAPSFLSEMERCRRGE